MSQQLNAAGAANLRSLMSSGKVTDAPWSFTATDGDKLLGAGKNDWANYAKWHLVEDTAAPEKSKARYAYPFGKGDAVNLGALRAIASYASKAGLDKVSSMASSMIDAHNKKNMSDPKPKFKITERFDMNLQDVQQSGDWQLVLPRGVIHTRGYGKVDFGDKLLGEIVQNWRDKVMGNREPFIDTDHDFGESNGWIKDMRVTDAGLEVKIDWTPAGVQKLTDQTYKYFSGSIGSAVDPKTGKEVFPVLISASLTNTPQIYVLPPAKLSDKGHDSDADDGSHRGGPDGDGEGEEPMTFAELKEKLKDMKLSDEERKTLLEQLGVTEKELDDVEAETDVQLADSVKKLTVQVESLKDANKALTDRLDGEVKTRRTRDRDEVIELALSEGRITPADKEKWVKRYDAAPEQVREIIESLPKVVDFSERGHAGGGGEQHGHVVTFADKSSMTLSEDDLTAAKKLHQSPEQYASILTGKKLPEAQK